jgi:type VI secretion system secreted protein Hcp
MAVDIFLKLHGVAGKSKDKVHSKEIDNLSWSWGMANRGSGHVGGGAGSGKVNVQDVSLSKYVDSNSPKLMLACCNGTHYKDALLTVRKVGGNPVEYFKVKLKKVLISGVSTGGSQNNDRLTENVILNFAKVSVDYTPQKDDGSAGIANPFACDVAANEIFNR